MEVYPTGVLPNFQRASHFLLYANNHQFANGLQQVTYVRSTLGCSSLCMASGTCKTFSVSLSETVTWRKCQLNSVSALASGVTSEYSPNMIIYTGKRYMNIYTHTHLFVTLMCIFEC